MHLKTTAPPVSRRGCFALMRLLFCYNLFFFLAALAEDYDACQGQEAEEAPSCRVAVIAGEYPHFLSAVHTPNLSRGFL